MDINLILKGTIILAVITGLLCAPKMNTVYRPFLILILTAFVNETVGHLLMINHHYNIVNTNIYCLAEALLIVWQFYRWDLFDKKKNVYLVLVTVLVSYWLIDNILLEGFTKKFNSYFIIGYSYLIVILSITQINKLITSDNRSLIKSATFIICVGFVIFFTYATLVEIFWKYGFTGKGSSFTRSVYHILQYLNSFVNIIYALAFLWIPKKPKFLLQS